MLREPYRIAEIFFVALTLTSAFFLLYTIYIFYGTKLALGTLKFQAVDVNVESNESQEELDFSLELHNFYWVELKIRFISFQVYHNNKEIGSRQIFLGENPLILPPYSTQNITLHLNIMSEGDQPVSESGIWRLHIKVKILSALPGDAEVSRTITKVML